MCLDNKGVEAFFGALYSSNKRSPFFFLQKLKKANKQPKNKKVKKLKLHFFFYRKKKIDCQRCLRCSVKFSRHPTFVSGGGACYQKAVAAVLNIINQRPWARIKNLIFFAELKYHRAGPLRWGGTHQYRYPQV